MKKLCLTVVLLSLFGCGGGSDGDDSESIAADDSGVIQITESNELCQQGNDAENTAGSEGESNDAESEQESSCSGTFYFITGDNNTITPIQIANADVSVFSEESLARVTLPAAEQGCVGAGDYAVCVGAEVFFDGCASVPIAERAAYVCPLAG